MASDFEKIINFNLDPLDLLGHRKEEEQRKDDQSKIKALGEMADTAPKYQIPEELQTAITGMQDTYSGLTDEAQQRLDERKSDITKAQQENMPGYQTYADQIGSASAQAVSQAQRTGGYGALGELSEIQQNQIMALRDLATQNEQYRRQQEQIARQREQEAFNQYAGLTAQGASAGLQGAQIMADQKATQFYQNQLFPWQTKFNVQQSLTEYQMGNKEATSLTEKLGF